MVPPKLTTKHPAMSCDHQINLKRVGRQKTTSDGHSKVVVPYYWFVRCKFVISGRADDGPNDENRARGDRTDSCLDFQKRGISLRSIQFRQVFHVGRRGD